MDWKDPAAGVFKCNKHPIMRFSVLFFSYSNTLLFWILPVGAMTLCPIEASTRPLTLLLQVPPGDATAIHLPRQRPLRTGASLW